MGAVMIRCPETGQDIPTGIVADRKSFAATPVFFARAYCPIVGPSTSGSPGKLGCAKPSRADDKAPSPELDHFGDANRAGPPPPFLSSLCVERTWRPSCPGHLAVIRRPPSSSRR